MYGKYGETTTGTGGLSAVETRIVPSLKVENPAGNSMTSVFFALAADDNLPEKKTRQVPIRIIKRIKKMQQSKTKSIFFTVIF